MFRLVRRALQIQFEQLRQDFFVVHAGIPPVGGEDSGVELLMGQLQPGRTLVVKVCQRAFLEFLSALGVLGNRAWIAVDAPGRGRCLRGRSWRRSSPGQL